MDVAISILRAELSTWIERARAGGEVVITDRGIPVARLVPIDTAPLIEQLLAGGVLSKPPPGRPTGSAGHGAGPGQRTGIGVGEPARPPTAMTIVYFHSSAFVKLLVQEDGSDLAAALWDGCDAAVSSRLAYPQVRAALAAAGRVNRLAAAEQNRAERAWEDFWAATRPVELTESITTRAGELAAEHGLRGGDAVHLASLLAVGAAETVFAGWDNRLRTQAQAAGVQLAPVA